MMPRERRTIVESTQNDGRKIETWTRNLLQGERRPATAMPRHACERAAMLLRHDGASKRPEVTRRVDGQRTRTRSTTNATRSGRSPPVVAAVDGSGTGGEVFGALARTNARPGCTSRSCRFLRHGCVAARTCRRHVRPAMATSSQREDEPAVLVHVEGLEIRGLDGGSFKRSARARGWRSTRRASARRARRRRRAAPSSRATTSRTGRTRPRRRPPLRAIGRLAPFGGGGACEGPHVGTSWIG